MTGAAAPAISTRIQGGQLKSLCARVRRAETVSIELPPAAEPFRGARLMFGPGVEIRFEDERHMSDVVHRLARELGPDPLIQLQLALIVRHAQDVGVVVEDLRSQAAHLPAPDASAFADLADLLENVHAAAVASLAAGR